MPEVALLQQVILAMALGALVGLERDRKEERKYAGLRTMALLTGAGPLAVAVTAAVGSAAAVGIYLLLVAAVALAILWIRYHVETSSIGFTTSASVFVMGMVGVLVGYDRWFSAVAVTLIAVALLAERDLLHRYMTALTDDELADAVKLGILALVLYPVLPAGAVDPYGVLFLRKALLFLLFILLIQFAAYVALKWLKTQLSFLVTAAVGGVVSSLAVVTTMAQFVRDRDLDEAASAAALAAVVAMVLRNGALAVSLMPRTAVFEALLLPFLLAAVMGAAAMMWFYRRADTVKDIEFEASSPFSFRAAFRFGVIFLAVLMVAELSKTYLSVAGVYGTAFLGGIGSSTAVVASAATLLSSGSVTPGQAAAMVALGAASSLLSKLVYVELGGARALNRRLLVPYLAMSTAVGLVLVF